MPSPLPVHSPLLRAWLVVLTAFAGCAEPDATSRDTPEDVAGTDHSQSADHPVSQSDGTANTASSVIQLRLETRTGTSTQGWSFDTESTTDSAQADLLLSSTDCGARGRWVTLQSDTVEFCIASDPTTPTPDQCGLNYIDVGGTEPELALGDVFFIRTAKADHTVELIDRTETPMDWYQADDLSFDVVLELVD